MIRYKCSRCKVTLESAVDLAGRSDQCPACGMLNRVPESSEPSQTPFLQRTADLFGRLFRWVFRPSTERKSTAATSQTKVKREPSSRSRGKRSDEVRPGVTSTKKQICRAIAADKTLEKLVVELSRTRSLGDQHYLYLEAIAYAYKHRKDGLVMRDICESLAWDHLDDFPRMTRALKRDIGFLPLVPTFQQLATVLTEKGEYDKAVSVCEQALSYGLRDGTKGDYEGRIERIRKKQASQRRQS